ncbi:hypothetical protein D3C85_128310 [compost metagenome]
MATDQLNVRAVGLEFLEIEKAPVSLRRVQGQILTSAKDPLSVRAVGLEFLEIEKTPASVRRIQGQMISLSRDPLSLRAFQVEYLELEVRPPAFTGNAWPKLLTKINEYNNTKFTEAQVTFENPTAVNLPGKYNTRLTLRALPGSNHSGTVDVYYPRFSVKTILKGDPKPFDHTGMDSVWDTLASVNALWGLNLTTSDVLDLPLEPSGDFFITIAPSSLYFIPGERYRYGLSVPLNGEFTVQDLGGFSLPTLSERFAVQDLPEF